MKPSQANPPPMSRERCDDIMIHDAEKLVICRRFACSAAATNILKNVRYDQHGRGSENEAYVGIGTCLLPITKAARAAPIRLIRAVRCAERVIKSSAHRHVA
jgi:hypothetical protein